MTGKKQFLAPMWKKLMKNLNIREPISCVDHVNLRYTQRECEPNKKIERFSKMFESLISARTTEKEPGCEKLHAKTVAWPCKMEGHAQKCVEHQFKQEELESVGELSQVCSQIVLKCLYLERPDILWSVNKLARSVTKWHSCGWQHEKWSDRR